MNYIRGTAPDPECASAAPQRPAADGGGGEGGGGLTVQGLPLIKPPTAASRRSISTRVRSSGRSRTARRRTTSGITRRSKD